MSASRFISTAALRAMQRPAASTLRSSAASLRRPVQFARPAQFLGIRQQVAGLHMRPTAALRMAVPKEEHAAHTISQRLRTLKKMPMELWPLFIVIAAAIFAAIYAMGHSLLKDKSLRLTRTGPPPQQRKGGDH